MLRSGSLFAMLFVSVASHAGYQAEVGVGYGSGSSETKVKGLYGSYDVDTKADWVALTAAAYLSEVDDSRGPLAEAAFLSKSSGVGLEASSTDQTVEEDGYPDYDYKDSFGELSGRFVLPANDIILQALVSRNENEDTDLSTWGVGFGKYLSDTSTLMLEFEQTDYDYDEFDEGDVSSKLWTLSYRQLLQFGNGHGFAFTPYLSYYDFEDIDGAFVGVRCAYYFSRSLGLLFGVEGGQREDGDFEITSASTFVGVDYFVADNFHIGARLDSTATEIDNGNSENDTGSAGILLTAAVRL